MAVVVMLLLCLAAAAADSPYARWSNGPSTDPAYFPIGVWLQSPNNAERYQEIGVNLYVGLWQGPTEAQLERLTQAGMRVICAQNAAGLRHWDDPIIAGWLQPDEPDNIPPVPLADLRAGYERMRRFDATRPVLLNFGQGIVNRDFRGRGINYGDYPKYAEAADIVSFDVYPVAGVADPRTLWYVPSGVDSLRTWTQDAKPVWNFIETTQINSSWRKATPRQVRAEVWMALVHGSRGILYFAHEFQPAFREARLLEDDEMRQAVAAINAQIHSLAPVLNSVSIEGDVSVTTSNPDVPVDIMLKHHGNDAWLFATSMREGDTKASIHIASAGPGTVIAEVAGEDRTVRIEDGVLVDDFVDFDVHLYRWSRSPMTTVSGSVVASGPAEVRLEPNHPNPFNGGTNFRFQLPGGAARLDIYNLVGQRVAGIVRAGAGVHEWYWDARNAAGAPLASGVYLARLSDSKKNHVRTRRLLLLR